MLLESEYPAQACSRAYYATFYAAEATLLTLGERRSKHTGVLAAFGEFVVNQGGFDADLGRLLRSLFAARTEADYRLNPMSRAEIDTAIVDARRFVDAVAAWIDERRVP